MTYYQVCFSRIGGQGSGDGWQAVNASSELPSEAAVSFTRFQNGNIYPPTFDAEDAADQIVTELQSDGNFVFLTRIKYGLKDQIGRPAMFAHSFVFLLNEFAQTPQDVLCVENSNFAFDIEQTRTSPAFLARTDALPVSRAMNDLAFTKDSYTTFLRCVYFVLDSKAKILLHVICDCRPETIQRIMVCVYSAVPFEFRKNITYSTYENQKGTPKTIIFNRQRSTANGYFVDPKTGENNVLSDVVLKRWEKYEFMKVAPHDPTANIDGYFRELEKKLSLFGSAQTTSLDLYKIAHDLILDDSNKTSALTPEALGKRLNEFLSIPINHPYLDQQIQYVLGDIVNYKVILNDILEEKLCRKLEKTQDQDLIEVGHIYNSEKISRMTVEEGGKYLFDTYDNRAHDSFIQMRKLLDRDAKGREILNYFYTELITEQLPKDKEHIIAFYEETLPLYDRSKIQESLCLMSYTYFKSTIDDKTDPLFLMIDVDELLRKVLRDRPALVSNTKRNVIKAYWDNFSYESLQIDHSESYKDVLSSKNNKAQVVFELLETYRFFESGDVDSFKKQVEVLFSSKSTFFTDAQRAVSVKKLQNACLDNRNVYDDYELDVWVILAFLDGFEKKNPVKFLIDNRLPGIRHFEEAYPKSRMLHNERTRERFVDYLNDYMQSKPEGYKIAADALRVIKEYEKRAKQDEKRQQKELRNAQREGSDKKSLFPKNLKGLLLFKKNSKDDDD